MESTTTVKKIFRARKTMNPSSRNQIESLNKLKKIWIKDRTSEEIDDESKTEQLNKTDPVCKNRSFSNKILNLESTVAGSGEKDQPATNSEVSAVLCIDSSNVLVPTDDPCITNHHTEEKCDPSEVRSYNMVTSPISEASFESPVHCNNDSYDQEILNLESKVSISEEMETSFIDVDVLGIKSPLNVCLPTKEECNSNCRPTESPDIAVEKLYKIDAPPVSQQSFGNSPNGQKFLNLECKVPKTEEMDMFPCAGKVSTEVLGTDLPVSVCSPTKDTWHSSYQTEPPEDNPYILITSPISEASLGSPTCESNFSKEIMDLESKVSIPAKINSSASGAKVPLEPVGFDTAANVGVPTKDECSAIFRSTESPSSPKLKSYNIETTPIPPQYIGNSLVCNKSSFGQEINNLESNVSVSEHKLDRSKYEASVSTEVLSTESPVKVSLHANDECSADHLPEKLLDFPEVKAHNIKTFLVPPPSIENSLLCESSGIGHKVLELESTDLISEQKDSSPSKVEMSLEDLRENSLVKPLNDACHSVLDRTELSDAPELKPYVTETSPDSPHSFRNIPGIKDCRFSQEIMNLDSKLPASEDIDTSLIEEEASEVLDVDSCISVCLPVKDECHSIHQPAEFPNSFKVNQNNIELPPISQQCRKEMQHSPSRVQVSAEVLSINSLVKEIACHSLNQMADFPNSQKVKLCGTQTLPISPESIGNSLICNHSTSGQQNLHLDANVPIADKMDTSSSKIMDTSSSKIMDTSSSKIMDTSSSKIKVLAEVLSVDSALNIFHMNDTCHSSHPTAESDSPKVKPHAIETSTNSEQFIDNSLFENFPNEMYEKNRPENLTQDSASDVNSKPQDSLSRRLHDMLVQEKKLIATTAPSALEVNKNGQAVKVTEQMDSTEKFIVPLNLSEEDEDEGLLPTLDRINANVDSNDVKHSDNAVNILQDLHSSSDMESLSISSVHLFKESILASDLEGRNVSNSDIQSVKCLDRNKTSENYEMDVDTNNDSCDESGGKSISYLGVNLTFPPKDTFVRCLEKKDSIDFGNVGREGVSQKEAAQGNLNSESLCKSLNESISDLEADVTGRSTEPFIESSNCSVHRKRLNSENETFSGKRFRAADDVSPMSKITKGISPVSEEIIGVSEKIRCLIDHQVQIFFADVFDHKLEQLTERVQVIQCGRKHEDLVAKCLRKLRRFEGHANIAIKCLKGMLRQQNMQPSVTETKVTVPVENLRLILNEKILTEKPLTVDPVDASATSKSPLPLCLKSISPVQSPTSAPVIAAAEPSDLLHLPGANPTKSIAPFSTSTTSTSSDPLNAQSVSPAVSLSIGPFSQREHGKESILLPGRDYESKSLPGKVPVKSLPPNSPDILKKDAATSEGNVFNLKSENKVVNDAINGQSGMVIDLTDEERSTTEAMSLTGQDGVMRNETLHLKEKETLRMKNMFDHKSNPLPNRMKLLMDKKYSQKSVEHIKYLETKTQANRKSDNDWTPKKSKMDPMKISDYKANPKHGKLKYGPETRQPHQSLGVDKTYMLPSGTNTKNTEKTAKKSAPAKRTFDESRAMSLDTRSNDDRWGLHKATIEHSIVNRSLSVPSCSRSEKEFTPNTLNPASEHCLHPSAPPQLRVGVQDSLPPQKMELKLTQVQNPRGIALSWNCTKIDPKCSLAQSYCLYVQQEDASCSKSEWKWKKIGEIKALPLPMACTLSQFVGGSRYYFTIRAKDMHERYGPFADVQSTTLLPLEKSRNGT